MIDRRAAGALSRRDKPPFRQLRQRVRPDARRGGQVFCQRQPSDDALQLSSAE